MVKKIQNEKIRSKFLKETKPERIGASRLEYLACVFCGKSQLLDAPEHPPFSGEIEPLRYKVFQKRVAQPGPGRGNKVKGVGGFKAIPGQSQTILQLMETHPELVGKIKARLLQIIGDYVEVGIISGDELPRARTRRT